MANMCVGTAGYAAAEAIRFEGAAAAALVRQGVAIAQFALSASDAVSNFRKLRDISSRGIGLEEQAHDHLKSTYWPAEAQMLAEFTEATAWEAEATLSKRYEGRLWPPLAAAFAREMDKLRCSSPRRCAHATAQRLEEMAVEMALTRANVTILARRIAFEEVQAIKDTDFKRRHAAIAMRQGMIAQAASLMATAAQGYSGAAGSALGAVNGAIQAFGNAFQTRNSAQLGLQRLEQAQTGAPVLQNRGLANYNDALAMPVPDLSEGIPSLGNTLGTGVEDVQANMPRVDTGTGGYDTSMTDEGAP